MDEPVPCVHLLTSMTMTNEHKLRGFETKLDMVMHACNTCTQEQKEEDLCKFEASRSYILNSKPALGTQ